METERAKEEGGRRARADGCEVEKEVFQLSYIEHRRAIQVHHVHVY